MEDKMCIASNETPAQACDVVTSPPTRPDTLITSVSSESCNPVPGPSVGLMALNDNKAGMTGLDTDKINAIIESASKGSKFYQAKLASQAKIDQQIERLGQQLAALKTADLDRARREADMQGACLVRVISY